MLTDIVGSWNSTDFYVVGPKTFDAITEAQKDASYAFPPSTRIFGANTGSGARLALSILDRCKELDFEPGSSPPFLYLAGDKSLATVPTMLMEGGYKVDVRQVYETKQRSGFEQDLRDALERRQGDGASFDNPRIEACYTCFKRPRLT